MRSRGLSFSDAVRLLDGDSPTVTWLGRFAGVAAGAVTVGSAGTVDFFALRNEVVRWGNSAVRSWRDRVEGLSRFDRTDRLIAAHSVIVLVAFFEALDELSASSPQLAAAEQVAISGSRPLPRSFTQMATALIERPAPHPTPQRPFEILEEELEQHYALLASTTVSVLGLTDVDIRHLAGRARLRYSAAYRRLVAEVPEFRLWAESVGEQATRELMREAIAQLREKHAVAAGIRGDLHRSYEAQLGRPILTATDVPGAVVLPTLREGYRDRHQPDGGRRPGALPGRHCRAATRRLHRRPGR